MRIFSLLRKEPLNRASRPAFSIIHAWQILLLALAYFITARYGLTLDAVSGFATLVWPPTGIAFAALLLFSPRLWPGILIGAFTVNYFVQGAPLFVAIAIACGNTLEAVVGVFILRHVAHFKNSFDRISTIFSFLTIILFSTAISATIGVTALVVANIVAPVDILRTWLSWWTGDILGALVVVPLCITLFTLTLPKKRPSFLRILEALALLCVFITICWVVFLNAYTHLESASVLIYLIFPLLIWASLRFGTKGAVLSTFATSVIAIWGTTLGMGPFIYGGLSHNLLLLQIFMGSMIVTALALSASFEERAHTHRDLLKQKNAHEALLESIGDGVIATNTDGRIILCNNAAEVMLRVSADEIIGERYDRVLNEYNSVIQYGEHPLKHVLSSGRTFRNRVTDPSYYYLRKDGTSFPISLTVSPVLMDGEIVGMINVFRDITREKEIDRSKIEFASLASHQLRTPLSTVKWYADMLLSGEAGEMAEGQLKYIREIFKSNERMADLLNALLIVSQIEMDTYTIEPRIVHIEKIAEEVLHAYAPKIADKHLIVRKNYDKKRAEIDVDEKIVRMIFQTLISNSIKYAHEGSEIRISIAENEDTISIEVSDDGHGIPASDQEKIFTKFFRAKNASTLDPDGSGLWLYILKSVLDRCGGTIKFTSKEHSGTTFFVTLPKE